MADEKKNNNSDTFSPLDDELDFDCQYSDNLPAILKELNISLAFTSYQAGRLMLVRSDGKTLDVNFKSFPRPMGLAATENGLTLGIFTQIINFQREDGLLAQIKRPLPGIEEDITAPRIKPKNSDVQVNVLAGEEGEDKSGESEQELVLNLSPEQQQQVQKQQEAVRAYQQKLTAALDERVDACFISRSAHYSGMINIHDIDWGDEGLWVVNSSFSCLCTLDPDYSFVPRWKPHFISELVPEDRCHLNGMTLKDGKPAYVTTFSKFDAPGKWRKGTKFDGTLMSVASNEVLVDGLTMPHSPRWYNDRVYYCNSGYGQICSYQPETKITETLYEVPGFTRGMDFYGPLMFVGLSKVRAADVTKPAPLSQKYDETYSGIWLFNLDDPGNKEAIGHIKFTGNVDQIYDVAVIPDSSFPELIEPSHPRMRNHFCHPELQALATGSNK
ncbi:TIGR03032 family protein [Thalassomonas actiniarum]|uniref:TIGR03032 family protein n=1 Tax=Thalassomonas actiniarum TaxID=485447 RepID=A0AAE9YQN7_9GAMM|nr:TIGR03032 family protein [Thalassomonas actiniarum]WDD98519.1 TIGR03032 family protein [Thalassomonas actiniarum]